MPEATADLHYLPIAEAARLIERRRLSPVELTQAYLDRIATYDPQLNAYLLVTADRALEAARAAEAEIAAGRYRGPMHGIPFALKDIYCTAGIRTTCHSRTRQDYVPDFDATTVSKLYEAGAVLLGKLSTHEFAHGGPSFDLPWPAAATPGTASTRPADRPADRAPAWRPAWRRGRWGPTPAGRSATPRRCAGWWG